MFEPLAFSFFLLSNERHMEEPPTGRRQRTVRRSVFFVTMLIMLICVFTVLGVSQVMELGSATFFIVVVAGVLVLLCFFTALIAYARAKLISVQNLNSPTARLPVFYYLQTIHRPVQLDPVPDTPYWLKTPTRTNIISAKEVEQCPICLCDMLPSKSPIGVSACCKRQIHIKCAQQYFNTVRQVKCVFCRQELTTGKPQQCLSYCPPTPSPSPSRTPTSSDV